MHKWHVFHRNINYRSCILYSKISTQRLRPPLYSHGGKELAHPKSPFDNVRNTYMCTPVVCIKWLLKFVHQSAVPCSFKWTLPVWFPSELLITSYPELDLLRVRSVAAANNYSCTFQPFVECKINEFTRCVKYLPVFVHLTNLDHLSSFNSKICLVHWTVKLNLTYREREGRNSLLVHSPQPRSFL